MKSQPDSKVEQFKRALREKYAWPGGYEIAIYLADGERLCPSCCREHYRSIVDSTKHNARDGWSFMSADIYWEGAPEFCAHCNREMPSEYGDPESDN